MYMMDLSFSGAAFTPVIYELVASYIVTTPDSAPTAR
jgi:hypothetical protein